MGRTIPTKAPYESKEQYQERLRQFVNKYYNKIPDPIKPNNPGGGHNLSGVTKD